VACYAREVNFNLSEAESSWKTRGRRLARELLANASAADVVMGAARVGLLDPAADLLALAVASEAMAYESVSTATAYALHMVGTLAVVRDQRFADIVRGEQVAALSLSSSDEVALERQQRISGRASWVAPITQQGVAIVGARREGAGELAAFAVRLDAPGVSVETIRTAALNGLVCAHVTFANAPCADVGSTLPVMARMRILIAASGLGIGRRALREALATARAAGELKGREDPSRRAAGEQTVQGLLADSATELDAAMLLTWKAAIADRLSLAEASMAKLAATAAAQRSVERATQVVGGGSFEAGHIIERLAQDVRALELFAGRTEALRAAVAETIR
jgi:alkylation response protein AidB-like acyl-CoA dehydrogenase